MSPRGTVTTGVPNPEDRGDPSGPPEILERVWASSSTSVVTTTTLARSLSYRERRISLAPSVAPPPVAGGCRGAPRGGAGGGGPGPAAGLGLAGGSTKAQANAKSAPPR